MNKNDALNIIDAKAGMLCAASDEIWGLRSFRCRNTVRRSYMNSFL